MHQFAFFSLSSLLSFSISLQLQMLVQVFHRDIARVPSQGLFHHTKHLFPRYKVPRTNADVGVLLRSKILPVYPREPQIAPFLTQIVSFSPLGALSWMVSGRTLLPFLYPTYCHTPPQHRSSPLLKARCCLATLSKALVVQLAQCIDTRRTSFVCLYMRSVIQ